MLSTLNLGLERARECLKACGVEGSASGVEVLAVALMLGLPENVIREGSAGAWRPTVEAYFEGMVGHLREAHSQFGGLADPAARIDAVAVIAALRSRAFAERPKGYGTKIAECR